MSTVIINILILSVRGRLYTSESDVYRREIVAYKDGPALKGSTYRDTFFLCVFTRLLVKLFVENFQRFAIMLVNQRVPRHQPH